MSVVIFRKFQVSPEVLSPNIDNNMQKIIQEHVVGSCSENNGYIIEAFDIKSKSASVSESNGLIDILVQFQAVCVKPKIGSTYSGRICLIFDMGALIDVAGVLKVLVPVTEGQTIINNKTYKTVFDQILNTLTIQRPSNPFKMEVGSVVSVQVSGVQYNAETTTFNCFGNLID